MVDHERGYGFVETVEGEVNSVIEVEFDASSQAAKSAWRWMSARATMAGRPPQSA
jgi:hypothetical protein